MKALWLCDEVNIDGDIKPFAHSYCYFLDLFLSGSTTIPTLNQPLSLSEFNGLWILISCLSGRRSEQVRAKIADATGISWDVGNNKSGFDYWSLHNRFNMLVVVFWLLEQWPNRFVDLALDTKLSKSAFSDYMHSLPFWLARIVNEDLDKRPYILTNEEICNAIKFLYKKDGKVSVIKLAKLLDMRISSCRDRLKNITNLSKKRMFV